jgi:hypothetical protein
MPDWWTDRNGVAGKAIHFSSDGGSIEVPYNTKLNPGTMSIALWIKADSISAGNRFIGLQSWIAYKFQLQEANRPFFTAGQTANPAYDRDSEQNLPINEWHHIAVTYGGGHMTFYVDGEMIKDWDNCPNPIASISAKPYNFVIGQDFPTDQYTATDANFDATDHPDYHKIPLAWGGHMRGAVDEVRIYNVALTGSQIGSIYDREAPAN